MSELPIWAIEAGVPSAHVTAAAVRVARMLDHNGSEISDLRRSYRQHASGAYFPEPDMIKGETLLVDCGLVRKMGSRLVPTADLLTLGLEDDREAACEITMHVLTQLPPDTGSDQLEAVLEATIPSAERREELLLALGAKFDDTRARLVGEIGEEIVVQAARDQLLAVGHPELAAQVRRVSLGSDALGYDVTASRTTGSKRLFEVKASTKVDEVEFYLSRNEWETGIRYADDWFLVYCRVDDTEQRPGEIIGWCVASSLSEHVPVDRGSGEWRSVYLKLSTSLLQPGLPY
jgi:Domain of unknown function (DUF3883)